MKRDSAVQDQENHSVSRSPSAPAQDWQSQLRNGYRDPNALRLDLGLPPRALPDNRHFPLRVPRAFVGRMGLGNESDPLLLQVMPDVSENQIDSGYSADPVGDLQSRSAPAVLHKYQGRALLITTGACAIHCRYCFRQHFPYAGHTVSSRRWAQALDYLADTQDVSEVILSGGDPLMLTTPHLEAMTHDLARLPHIRRFRIHTRMPIVLPDRVTDRLLSWLNALPWPTTVVVHANHPNEFDDSVQGALARLRTTGAHLLNQAVLMRKINDSADVLAALMERSFDAGVLPYYLHQLDRVAGAARYEVDVSSLETLMHELRLRLPGYLVPRLVREQSGQPYKLPVL
ncbi:MAG: EF-P beta-lysylation protein EpmB [Wenzhouxiangella sp.]|nr:EF-P beta-lysylation protein EpmB [Wenzhouxiangella sp.]